MKLIPARLKQLFLLVFILTMAACKTQDVYPTLTLAVSTSNLNDNGGNMRVIARLNGPISDDITVPLIFTGFFMPGLSGDLY